MDECVVYSSTDKRKMFTCLIVFRNTKKSVDTLRWIQNTGKPFQDKLTVNCKHPVFKLIERTISQNASGPSYKNRV